MYARRPEDVCPPRFWVSALGRASALTPSGRCARSIERIRSFGPVRAVGQAHSLLRACMWHPYAIGQLAHGTRQPRGPAKRMRSPDLDWLRAHCESSRAHIWRLAFAAVALPRATHTGGRAGAGGSRRRARRVARNSRAARGSQRVSDREPKRTPRA